MEREPGLNKVVVRVQQQAAVRIVSRQFSGDAAKLRPIADRVESESVPIRLAVREALEHPSNLFVGLSGALEDIEVPGEATRVEDLRHAENGAVDIAYSIATDHCGAQ